MPPAAAVARRRFRARGRDGALLIGRALINRADIMKPQDKASDFQLYLRLLTYVKPYHRVFAVAVAAMVVLALVNPAMAALFKRITEGVFSHRRCRPHGPGDHSDHGGLFHRRP